MYLKKLVHGKGVDPDQTPQNAVSDQCHPVCIGMSSKIVRDNNNNMHGNS